MSTIWYKALHRKWMENPVYKAEYDSLEQEFAQIAKRLEAGGQIAGRSNAAPRGGPAEK